MSKNAATMSLRLENNTTIPLKYATVGMLVEKGGEILSLTPFITSLGQCVLNEEVIELHKTGDQRVAVYLENVRDVTSYNAYFVFHGNTVAELREELLDRLGWSSEYLPTIEFYTSRSGAFRRPVSGGHVLSKKVDSVYVYMK